MWLRAAYTEVGRSHSSREKHMASTTVESILTNEKYKGRPPAKESSGRFPLKDDEDTRGEVAAVYYTSKATKPILTPSSRLVQQSSPGARISATLQPKQHLRFSHSCCAATAANSLLQVWNPPVNTDALYGNAIVNIKNGERFAKPLIWTKAKSMTDLSPPTIS